MNSEALAKKVKNSGMKPEEIALKLGVSVHTLYAKIRGEREFKISETLELKGALHLSKNEFMKIFFE